MNINHDLISMYPPLIVEPLFEVTSIHCSTYMAKMEVQIKLLKTVHFSRITPTFVYIVHCNPIVTSCISCSECYRTQPFMAASGEETFKRNPILLAQGMVVHEQDFYHFWVHYPVLGHCRIPELISSIAEFP